MDRIKEKLLDTVGEYTNKHCGRKGKIKEHNLTKEEEKAIKDMKRDIKEKKIVVFSTDKSGKFSVDTSSNYEEAVMKHTTNDVEVSDDRVKQIGGRNFIPSSLVTPASPFQSAKS